MPKISRKFVMTRPWAIFRQTYCYPQIKFSDIGRKCFAWALRQPWVEAREAARVAAMTPTAKADRIETLRRTAASTAKRAGRMREHSPGPDHQNPSQLQSEISR
jgi:hypothetical protein